MRWLFVYFFTKKIWKRSSRNSPLSLMFEHQYSFPINRLFSHNNFIILFIRHLLLTFLIWLILKLTLVIVMLAFSQIWAHPCQQPLLFLFLPFIKLLLQLQNLISIETTQLTSKYLILLQRLLTLFLVYFWQTYTIAQ